MITFCPALGDSLYCELYCDSVTSEIVLKVINEQKYPNDFITSVAKKKALNENIEMPKNIKELLELCAVAIRTVGLIVTSVHAASSILNYETG